MRSGWLRNMELGEFGVYRTADMASRVVWTETERLDAERLSMP
ncbi:hypothetical protein [Paenibacillus sp. 2TAB26]